MSKADLQDLYDITSPGDELSPSYNVVPTQQVDGVLERPRSGDDSNGGVEPERQLRALRWGLVPSWAKDPAIGSKLINARVETLADKPAWRHAFRKRRVIPPA